MPSADPNSEATALPFEEGAERGRRRRRRWPYIVVGIVLVLATAAAGLWLVWLPNWRPSLHAGDRYGVDVSAHQGSIDWGRAAGDGITFAYVKATEGGDFVDQRFSVNWTGATAAGIDRGAYHFFTLCTPGDVQAHNFLMAAPPDPGALAPAVDLELAGNCQARPDPTTVNRELATLLRTVESAWRKQVIVYASDGFVDRYPLRQEVERPRWYSRFLRGPKVEGWTIWQVDGFAHVSGIDGDVDLDVMRAQSP